MTDKVDSWIWYYDTIYKRTKKLTLGVFLNKINNRTLVNDATRVYFSTEKELEEFLTSNFFPRSGGGIGVTRMIRAMKLSNLLQ